MTENLAGIHCFSKQEGKVKLSEKSSTFCWEFELTGRLMLHRVVLLLHNHRQHFTVNSVKHFAVYKDGKRMLKSFTVDTNEAWTHPDRKAYEKAISHNYTIIVRFSTQVYGAFKQTVLFDFGTLPLLSRVSVI